ncbi:hypothetical protein [Oceanobacillus sp. FSL H7-0719]|uniref:hypothetical protein n=1 Tax=Oceanobacillus sp. FSL H7-0719 TaxID=2954507 RepID=UPI003247CB5B
MKSVMVFDSKDSQQETERKWLQWFEDTRPHKSAVGDKAVMTAEETRAYMRKYDVG